MSVRNDHELPRSQADVSDYGHTWTDQSPVEVQEAIRRAECMYVPFFSVIAIATIGFCRRAPLRHRDFPRLSFAAAVRQRSATATSVTPSVLKGNAVGTPWKCFAAQ